MNGWLVTEVGDVADMAIELFTRLGNGDPLVLDALSMVGNSGRPG